MVVFLVITVTFFMMRAMPGGPFDARGDKAISPQVRAVLEKKYNLDAPLGKQYVDYLTGVLRGDFGNSMFIHYMDVAGLIKKGAPVSATIGGLAIVIAIVFGLPLGIVAALKQHRWPDHLAMVFALVLVSVPSLVMAPLLMYVFAHVLKLLPPATWSWTDVRYWILPSLALSAFPLAFMARLTRSSMLEVLSQDYIRTARSKGLSELAVVTRHMLRNGLVPVVAFLGQTVPFVLTGSFVVEHYYALPGIGRDFVASVANRDYTVTLGLTVFLGIFLAVWTLITDIITVFIDPRIRLAKE